MQASRLRHGKRRRDLERRLWLASARAHKTVEALIRVWEKQGRHVSDEARRELHLHALQREIAYRREAYREKA